MSAQASPAYIMVVAAHIRGDTTGWKNGAPPAPGLYERLTSHLGIRVDRWDGRTWRRRSKGQWAPECANQYWPWRWVASA